MDNFNLIEDIDLDELDNLDLLEYKKELYKHGYEIESYLEKCKNQWILINQILQERIHDIEHDLALLQADKEDDVAGETNSPIHFIH